MRSTSKIIRTGFAAAGILGLLACATPARTAAGQSLRTEAAGYEMQVLVGGQPAATFAHDGETYVLGRLGERYVLRIHNHTGRRIEAVVSVDGRDVIDGRPADFRGKRGYLVPAWGSVDIDGWRLSQREAAAFRFSSVADSYSARMGNAREVGVIGVAVFPERIVERPRPYPVTPQPPYPYPYRNRYDEDARGGAAKDKAELGDSESQSRSEPSLAEAESAPAPAAKGSMAPQRRPGLGTEFGEAVESHIREVMFVRHHPNQPSMILGARYNDRDGLLAMGIDVDGLREPNEVSVRRTALPFPVTHRRYSTPPPRWQY